MKFTKELIEKAKDAGTAEELKEIAEAEGMELTADEAEKAFARLHKTGELADEELDNVTGGGCRNESPDGWEYSADKVKFLYEVGQVVEVFDTRIGGLTTRSRIIKREVGKTSKVLKGTYDGDPYSYFPTYYCEELEKPENKKWVDQDMIELP